MLARILTPLFLLATLLSGCATTPIHQPSTTWHYATEAHATLLEQFAPIISVEQGAEHYNRLGEVIAQLNDKGEEEVLVVPDTPVLYSSIEPFTTQRGEYQNLIYRFHFPEVPQLHLTAGQNVGLFVVITLNSEQQPVLITTVHTCGCYIAFTPTNFLPKAHYPDDWPSETQTVFGETLPTAVNYPEAGLPWRANIHVRSATHRVHNISIDNPNSFVLYKTELQPRSNLTRLPLADGYTSFFHESGANRGYVKNSVKPWERLLMSWWAFDWRIGSDKQLGPEDETGTLFYTSLKPWNRRASNMADFPRFLEFWGWGL